MENAKPMLNREHVVWLDVVWICGIPLSLQIPFAAVIAFTVSWILVILIRKLSGKYAKYIVG